MQPPTADLWHPVPGYSSDDEEDGNGGLSEKELELRQTEVISSLGPRFSDRPVIQFMPAPMPGSKQAAQVQAALAQSQSQSQSSSAGPKLAGRWTQPTGNHPPMFHLHSDAPILKETFLMNGMTPTNNNDFAIHWSGPNIRDVVYQTMTEHQRINHFPGSTELTRKDRLWCHFAEMAEMYGTGAFDFVPETYVLPEQVEEFLACYERTKCSWIVKPNASSRGRGIFMLRDLSELPLEETMVVSRYVDNPLLIQGLKFDLRVYVLVTAFEPLKAYIYREGLTRFASKTYSTKEEHMQDAFRHLTNYSINKNSCKFVENSDLRADNVGHKWSLSALNKHLHCVGVDVNLMWVRIMDLIVKTLLSVEPAISSRTRQMTPNRENCFELYGFDVLVDEGLKPWLLEVNLSPSMQAESPLDWQIKSSLIADAFNLVGICATDRAAAPKPPPRSSYAQQPRQDKGAGKSRSDPQATAAAEAEEEPEEPPLILNALTDVQLKMLVKSMGELSRCHNFVPLYPTKAAVQRYGVITEAREKLRAPPLLRNLGMLGPGRRMSVNQMLASILFGPRPVKSVAQVRSRSMPMLRAGGRPAESTASDSPGASVSTSDDVGEDDGEKVPILVADLDGMLGPQKPSEEAKAPLAQQAAAEGAAVLSATSGPGLQLPASVRDPDVKPESREAALHAAGRALRSLGGETLRRRRRRWKALKAEDAGSITPGGDLAAKEVHHIVFEGEPDEDPRCASDEEATDDDCDKDGKSKLAATSGCRLLLMEYLIRLEAACDGLGAVGRAGLAQSSSYGRLCSFQRLLPTAAAKLALDREIIAGGTIQASTSEKGGLIDDLAASCRDGLEILERLTWREADERSGDSSPTQARHESEDEDDDEEAEDSDTGLRMEGRGMIQHRLPRAILRQRSCQKLLKALPELGASDLEVLLRGPLCAGQDGAAGALKPLLDGFAAAEWRPSSAAEEELKAEPRLRSMNSLLQGPYGALGRLPGVAESQPLARRRGSCPGEVNSSRPTGPLSELLKAALNATRRLPPRSRQRLRQPVHPQARCPANIVGRPSLEQEKLQAMPAGPGVRAPVPPDVLTDAKTALANGIMMPPPRVQQQNAAMLRRSFIGKQRADH
eukprot:TRINITY_DN25047_c0_g1_i2.p1 TRINITY_DN25047_c0_g1~~TRINITY_DN25047_c0_g1_i2.p1  ORF type:complete len:1120 (-),score=230.23 TRINITY_DN25047_c0_g1_i2:276-3635(-)